jgi:hypothetical protein
MVWPSITEVLHWFVRYRPRYAAVIAVLTGLLLFLPQHVLKYFGLDVLARDHRGIISLFFGGALILLMTYPIEQGWKRAVSLLRKRKYRSKVRENLESAGVDEISILVRYVETRKNTILIPTPEMAVAQGLMSKGIMHPAHSAARRSVKYGGSAFLLSQLV